MDSPSTVEQNGLPSNSNKDFFGHPGLLMNLFGLEMWERFSFYGMQGILLIYLYYSVTQNGLGLSQNVAMGIVGSYGGIICLSTMIGGWMADRLFGVERTLFYNGILIIFGHIALAIIPGIAGALLGLLCVAIGCGGLKASVTTLVGSLYRKEDSRRDAGFLIFYMGINIGGFLGPLLTGPVQQTWGFHYGFALAAIGMTIGLAQYMRVRKLFRGEVTIISNPLPGDQRLKALGIALTIVAALIILGVTKIVRLDNLPNFVFIVIFICAVGYFIIILRSPKLSKEENSRIYALIPLFIISAVFWSLYAQVYTVVTLYTDQRLDRSFGSWVMPVSWVLAIAPIWCIIFSSIFATLWTKLGDKQPSTPIKFSLSLAMMGVSYLAFLPMAGSGTHSASPIMLAIILLGFTFAELLISPVGLSLSTKLAPAVFKAQVVALFFLSIALGNVTSGYLGKFYSPEHEMLYFGTMGATGIGISVVIVLISPWIKTRMQGIS